MKGLLFALCLIASAGCGYRFTGGAPLLPEGITRVEVPLFDNRTAEPGLEVLVTQAMREQVARRGLGTRGLAAQGRIEGEILTIGGGVAVSERDNTTQVDRLASYRLHLDVRLRLKKGDRAVSEVHVSGWEDYLPAAVTLPSGQVLQGEILEAEANRQAAFRRLAQTLMQEGLERLASAF